jgi:lipoprotein-anchoring transpeptidase ErfK/SrfK
MRDLDFYDNSSTDPDRFVEQTTPVWSRRPVMVREKVIEHTVEVDYPVGRPLPAIAGSYGQLDDHGHLLPAIPVEDVDPSYLRREVAYDGPEKPGTIIVETRSRHLFLVLGHGKAMRYGVGIGRQGYAWKGKGVIRYKRSWPKWTPSDGYVAERPDMKMFSASYGGLVGGINNPLGARALYIFQNGKDTLYRVHGTPDWKSVGKNVSSGCVRMFNQDVIDLYSRVRDGAEIIVR